MVKRIGNTSYKVEPISRGGRRKFVNHHRLKKDYERPQRFQSTYSDGGSDSNDANDSASDLNSIESHDRRLDIDNEDVLGPQLDEEPAERETTQRETSTWSVWVWPS